MYRLMKYTSRAACFDGVVREFESTGYFSTVDVLRHHLARWNGAPAPGGGAYEYFETPEQALANNQSRDLPRDFKYPAFRCLWNGKQQHNYHFVK